jgi:hypothetical protein
MRFDTLPPLPDSSYHDPLSPEQTVKSDDFPSDPKEFVALARTALAVPNELQ